MENKKIHEVDGLNRIHDTMKSNGVPFWTSTENLTASTKAVVVVILVMILGSLLSFYAQADELVKTSPYGDKLYHKESLTIKDGKIYQTSPYGDILYHKESYTIEDDGSLTKTSPYGDKLYHKKGFEKK